MSNAIPCRCGVKDCACHWFEAGCDIEAAELEPMDGAQKRLTGSRADLLERRTLASGAMAEGPRAKS